MANDVKVGAGDTAPLSNLTTSCGSAGGQPGYLLAGGIGRDSDGYRDPFWPDYGELLHFWKSDDGYLGLWRRTISLQEAVKNIGG